MTRSRPSDRECRWVIMTQPSSSTARPWTGRFNRGMIRSGPWGAAMDVGGWLRSLGLGQYEALFRASEIDADILTRPVALKDLGFTSAYLFGAVCPSQGKVAALIMPICNTAASFACRAESCAR